MPSAPLIINGSDLTLLGRSNVEELQTIVPVEQLLEFRGGELPYTGGGAFGLSTASSSPPRDESR